MDFVKVLFLFMCISAYLSRWMYAVRMHMWMCAMYVHVCLLVPKEVRRRQQTLWTGDKVRASYARQMRQVEMKTEPQAEMPQKGLSWGVPQTTALPRGQQPLNHETRGLQRLQLDKGVNCEYPQRCRMRTA